MAGVLGYRPDFSEAGPGGILGGIRTPTGGILGSGVDYEAMMRQLQGAQPDSLLTYLGVPGAVNDKIAQSNLANFGPGMVRSAVSGFTAPGDALAGRYDPMTDLSRIGDMAGMVTLGAGAMPAAEGELGMGIRAYHGSPHDFDAFDMSKIGTGEGAQVYGHGLYFAENPDVAAGYRDKLSKQVTYQNAPLGTHPMDSDVETAKHSIASVVADGGDPKGAIVSQASEWRQSAADYARHARNMKYPEETRAAAAKQAESFNRIAAEIEKFNPADFAKNPGKQYEVSINADPEHFLDWDKPLSEQPKAVQEAFGKVVDRDIANESGWRKLTGEQALKAVQERGGTRGQGEADLRAAGIKGIRYKDAGSRATSQEVSSLIDQYGSRDKALDVAKQFLAKSSPGDFNHQAWSRVVGELENPQTHNYVVFDDKIIDILKKYGIAGLTGGAGAALAMQPQPKGGT